MGDVASFIRSQFTKLHAQWISEPANINVEVYDFSSFVTSNNETFIAIATSSLTGLIGDWCRSSPDQRHVPIITHPDDFLPAANQGKYALCLHDNSLRISPSSIDELQDLVLSACECLRQVLRDRNAPIADGHIDSLDYTLQTIGDGWLDINECTRSDADYTRHLRPLPLDQYANRYEEDTESLMTQIRMHPATPTGLAATFSPSSPFSPDSLLSSGSLSSGSEFCLSQSSTTSSLPEYWDSTRDVFKQYHQYEQGTVSPQDVFAQVPIYGVDDPMLADDGLGFSPTSRATGISQSSSPQITDIAMNTFFDAGGQVPAQNLNTTAGVYLSPLSPISPVPDSRPIVSSRRKSKGSRSMVPYPSSSPYSRPSPMRNPSNKIDMNEDIDDAEAGDDDDDYNPIPPTRKVVAKKAVTATPSPSCTASKLGRGNKFPAVAWCDHCNKDFTRTADKTRHMKTCKKNPNYKGQKESCCYCGQDAPVRGDSAKRHWRSEACRQGAEDRGRAPYVE